jgi:hypothetical protein
MARRLAIRNANLFDSAAGVMRPGSTIVIEGERIAAVTQQPIAVDDARVIDAGGACVLPGLIDAHVHVVAASHDLAGLALQPPSLVGAQSSRIMRACCSAASPPCATPPAPTRAAGGGGARSLRGPAPVHRRLPDQPDRRPCRHAAQGRARAPCSAACAGLG